METQVEDFNWNLRLFLNVLSTYQTKVNKANPVTLELLEKTVDAISDLIGNVEEVETGHGDAILCTFDEINFEIKRTIFCRICKVDIIASRLNYLLHLADSKHNAKLIDAQWKDGALPQNGDVFDSNNNSSKGDDLDLLPKKNDAAVIQRPNFYSNSKQETTTTNTYSASMASIIAGLDAFNNDKISNDSKVNIVNKNGLMDKTIPTAKTIPSVFDDNIYDFIESIGKQGQNSERPKANESVNEPPKFSWRDRTNEPPVASVPIGQWRAKKDDVPVTSTPVTIINPKPIVPVVTESIIQNGAVLTGAGVKPCATYELNNLYLKFPHLNPNKVANPLKPVPLKDLKRPAAAATAAKKAPEEISDPKLQDFFDKVNKEHAKKMQQQLNSGALKKTELTNSLLSLPAFLNNNSNPTAEEQLMRSNRMPPRSNSSFNLTGISRIEGSNPQRGSQKSSPMVSGQNGNNRNQNGKTKGGSSTPNNDPRSKGAIPKQTTKNTPQTSSATNQKSSNTNSSKMNQDSQQKKDTKNEQQKLNEKSSELKNLAVVVNHEQMKKFFSGDLSALISMMISLNLRRKNATQLKIIESIENTLKPKFKTMKCHVIGSHVYNIAKGGLATLDVYLDLHNSFITDKSGPTFVTGMNEALKLLQQNNNEWSDAKCSEQTRYGILSVTHKATNQKCQFSFGTGVAVRNTDILNSLFDAQPVARQMAICVRLALQEGANGDWAKSFSGYVVALLVVFYLQIAGKLPSVLSLQSDQDLESMKCGENLVHFKKPTNVTICKDRIRDLLIGFFDYYEKFDFFNKIISPFEGREINQNFRNCAVDSLSRSMRRFKNLIDTEPHRWTNNRMCIQDIFEHKRNVAQSIQTKEMKAFADFCGKALLAIRDAGNSVKY